MPKNVCFLLLIRLRITLKYLLYMPDVHYRHFNVLVTLYILFLNKKSRFRLFKRSSYLSVNLMIISFFRDLYAFA